VVDESAIVLVDRVYTLAELRLALAAQGLHVVSAAEKAVLDTMALADLVPDGFVSEAEERAVVWAELARREGKLS